MEPPRRGISTAALLFGAALLAIPGQADDWPQFRKDAQRSAASEDRVVLPLTEIWSRSGSPCSIWKERAYFVTSAPPHRLLVCADVRTGAPIWTQKLAISPLLHEDLAPSITGTGILYVQDEVRLVHLLPHRTATRAHSCTHLAARTFSAATGEHLGFWALPGWPHCRPTSPPLLRLFLMAGHGPPDQQVLAEPTAGATLFPHHVLGPPLLVGDDLTAASQGDLFFRWNAASASPAVQVRLAHPIPGLLNTDVIPLTRLGGFPPVYSAAGVVVGEDATHRFLTALDGVGHPAWHRDIDWTLGIPSATGDLIVTGVGGPGARRGILAVDAATGLPRWQQPSGALAPDPQAFPGEVLTRTYILPENRDLRLLQSGVGPFSPDGRDAVRPPVEPPVGESRSRSRSASERQRPNLVRPQPPARAPIVAPPEWSNSLTVQGAAPTSIHPHGHHGNPGLVIVRGRVYGEISGAIVALDSQTGRIVWRQPLREGPTSCLIASRDHLFVTTAGALHGFRLDNGELEWTLPGGGLPNGSFRRSDNWQATGSTRSGRSMRVEQSGLIAAAGNLGAANGLLYVSGAGGPALQPKVRMPGQRAIPSLRALAPAERTYHLALDSDRPADYLAPGAIEEGGKGAREQGGRRSRGPGATGGC